VDLLLDRKAKESKLHRLSQDLWEFIFSSSSSTAVRRQAAKPKGSRAATPTLVAITLANVVVKSPGRCAISEAFWLQGGDLPLPQVPDGAVVDLARLCQDPDRDGVGRRSGPDCFFTFCSRVFGAVRD
jgi:hypothetical protein